ncbi:MAG: guanylate kinase [Candidatus Pelagibacter sp.]|nr:guanylate kinase [Candidatus Pelagibacter sp.]|tara:strand:+ start:14425 stop:14997 length:573 start_codon:yes stop_codon:yes gene_type:complete
MENPSSKPLMLVLSSPSGAGKTTLSKKIQQSDNAFKISVSHTTRRARPNEVDGVDYHFINEQKFKDLLKNNAFYEHSIIFGNYYGTSKEAVDAIIKEKCNVLFDIDWKGAKQLSEFKELNLLKIFILPPSKKELEKRLIARNQDGKDSIKDRLHAYSQDIKHANEYDHVIVNDNVDVCFNEIKKIISERL